MGLKRAFKRVGKFGKRLLKNPLVQTLAPIALNMFLPGVGGLIGKAAFGAAAAKANDGNPLLGAGMGALGHFTSGGGMGKGAPTGSLGIVEGEGKGPFAGLFRGQGGGGALGSEGIEDAMHGGGSSLGDKFSGFFKNPDGSIRWGRAIGAGAGALGLLSGMSGSDDSSGSAPLVPAGFNDPAKYQTLARTRSPVAPDYYTYGKQGGEHRFFGDPTYTDGVTTPPADVGGTGAGAQPATGYAPRELLMRQAMGLADGGHVSGPGTGRSDSIEALLSDGEYVMDAETVALLGDGSLDAGAERLDQLRTNLRKHKGAALAKGKFSPAAKDPAAYIPGMAKGGRMRVVGGQDTLPARHARLSKVRKLEDDLRAEKDDPRLQAALSNIERLKALRAKSPIQRAEGGPVAEMNELGDKLEAALSFKSIPEVDTALTPLLGLAKGGSLRAAVEAMRAKVNKGLNPALDPLDYLKMKHPQGSPIIDMIEGRRTEPIDIRRARTPEEQAAEQRILQGVELLQLLKGVKPQ